MCSCRHGFYCMDLLVCVYLILVYLCLVCYTKDHAGSNYFTLACHSLDNGLSVLKQKSNQIKHGQMYAGKHTTHRRTKKQQNKDFFCGHVYVRRLCPSSYWRNTSVDWLSDVIRNDIPLSWPRTGRNAGSRLFSEAECCNLLYWPPSDTISIGSCVD